MRRFFLILLSTVMACLSYAQQPELPQDYFTTKNFSISPGLDVRDTIAIRKEMNRLADSIYTYCKAASTHYRITDSALRLAPASGIASTATYKARYQEAYDSLIAYTKPTISRTTINVTDFMLELYIRSHLANTPAVLTEAIHKKVASLDKDYQKDNISTLKGAFHADIIQVLDKRIVTTLQQAATTGNNQIEYSNALVLVRSLELKDLLQRQHAIVQQALYALDPAKVEKLEVAIPMRDGIKLNALVFLDVNATEKQPAIISQSPYPSGTEATRGNIFGSYGYVYVYVDCRGRRSSEGDFFPYENDARDYYDIIDWISKQPWCNGKVGTSGGSYLGFAQWQAIRKQYRHPALKAINPMVSVGFGVDFPRESNIFYTYILQWAAYVQGKELNQAQFSNYNFWRNKSMDMYRHHIPFSKWDSVAGIQNEFFRKWVSHPDFDDYWKSILPKKEDYASLDIPVLTITGYYDDDQNGAMYYYNNHHKYGGDYAQNNHHMLIGPYDHGGSQWNPGPNQLGKLIEKEAQIPIYKYVIAWFDWRLKGKEKPGWIKDKITYFATGTGQWKGASSLRAVTTDTLQFYLSSHRLTSEKRRTMYQLQSKPLNSRQQLTYKHNITEVLDSAFLFATPKPDSDSLSVASKYNMIFETAPLQNDILVSDRITADLYVSLNVPDADLWVSFTEITPDGKYKPISYSLLRCRYRNGGDKPMLMTPGKPEKLSFNDAFIYIKKIAKGSRLRVELESLNRPFYEKNYGFGGVVANESTSEPRIIEATILMSKKYPSCIKVPVGKL
jgi:putative CocE/NonD family hydrolase